MSDNWQQRVRDEHHDLVQRKNSLGAFIRGDKFESLSETQQQMLKSQLYLMGEYGDILVLRIGTFPMGEGV